MRSVIFDNGVSLFDDGLRLDVELLDSGRVELKLTRFLEHGGLSLSFHLDRSSALTVDEHLAVLINKMPRA